MIVTHPLGCQDSVTYTLDVKPEVRYFIPNAFTPNFDTTNDIFKGKGTLPGISNFRMQIWNRWGALLFESSDPNDGWNGTKFNNGKLLQAGVYVYYVDFIGPRGKSFHYEGFVTLVR